MMQQGVLLLLLDGMLVHHRVPSMKQLGVLLLPPGWDASPSQGTQHDATRSITTSPPPHLDAMPVHQRVPSMKQLGVLTLPPGWDASPSQGTQHEATRSITTPPGWDASPSQGTQHEATRNITTPAGWDASPLQGTQHESTRSITTLPWMGCQSRTVLPSISQYHSYFYIPPA